MFTRAAVWSEAPIQRSLMPHQRASIQHLLFEFQNKMHRIWKMRLCFLTKVAIYKTRNFELSSVRAVVDKLCIWSVHMNTLCIVTPLLLSHPDVCDQCWLLLVAVFSWTHLSLTCVRTWATSWAWTSRASFTLWAVELKDIYPWLTQDPIYWLCGLRCPRQAR